MSKYSVEFYPGEDDRLPMWEVVRWESEMNGVKMGKYVFRSYDMVNGETECEDYMAFCIDMDNGFDAPSFDGVNAELADIAEREREEAIDLQYEEMVDALCAEHDMMMYAAHSYDNDAIYYGAQ